MRLGSYPASLQKGSVAAAAYGSHRGHRAAPAPLRGGQRLPRPAQRGGAGLLRDVARRPAGRVRRAAARGAPVLRRHPGAPGAEEPPHPAAPAVLGVRAGGDRLPGGGAAADGRRTRRRRSASDAQRRRRHEFRVLDSEQVYEGRVISLRRDTVAMPGGGTASARSCTTRARSAVVALDDDDRVVLLRQYRHPVGAAPVGAAGRPPRRGRRAARWRRRSASWPRRSCSPAARWSLLLSVNNSPGFSDELVHIFLAEELVRPTVPTASSSSTRRRT